MTDERTDVRTRLLRSQRPVGRETKKREQKKTGWEHPVWWTRRASISYRQRCSTNVNIPKAELPRIHDKRWTTRISWKATQSGWTNEEIFVDYMRHFIRPVKPSVSNKALIILDNHDSHITLEAIDLAKQNGIILRTLRPHTSHRLQILDITVFGPFKSAFNSAMDAWLRSNSGRSITIYEIALLVCTAQLRALTAGNIVSGFGVTGV